MDGAQSVCRILEEKYISPLSIFFFSPSLHFKLILVIKSDWVIIYNAIALHLVCIDPRGEEKSPWRVKNGAERKRENEEARPMIVDFCGLTFSKLFKNYIRASKRKKCKPSTHSHDGNSSNFVHCFNFYNNTWKAVVIIMAVVFVTTLRTLLCKHTIPFYGIISITYLVRDYHIELEAA